MTHEVNNMAIMRANDAMVLSKNAYKFHEIMKRVEEYIQSAVDDGRMFVNVPIEKNTPQEVRNKIFGILNDLGYEVRISPYGEKFNDPEDVWKSDVIDIRWMKN